MVEKFFTPKEANQILPEIKKIVEEILSKAQEARILMTTPGPLNEHQEQLIKLDHCIKILIAQLEDKGCYYKDWNFEIGLVDFPAIIHGQQALLCWRSDETQVEWFHGYEDGYTGRRKVTEGVDFFMIKKRCGWCTTDPIYMEYHDKEWGRPVHDDRLLFEFLILEGAQAGLSWLTVLKKRENYRKAFNNFDAAKIARYNGKKIKELLKNEGIIRNRLKIASAIANAKAFLAVQEEFGTFDKYIWQFVDGKPRKNHFPHFKKLPAKTPPSDAMSQDLKKRGFNFVGSTICYAFMQAVGMVNDHTTDCFCYR